MELTCLAQKGTIGKLPIGLIALDYEEILRDMNAHIRPVCDDFLNESGVRESRTEILLVFQSTEDLLEFEKRSGVQLESPTLVMTGPELPQNEWPIGMATRQDPAVAAFLDFRSKPSPASFYKLPCNRHTYPVVLALGVVPTIFEDVRDTACVLRSLHAGIEIFNAVLCLWRSAGLYPWEKDLNEAQEWLLRADAVLVSRQEEAARLMIANAITEIDKLRVGNYGKTED